MASTAATYVQQMAKSYGMHSYVEDSDYELRPSLGSAADLIQVVFYLQEAGFKLTFSKDNSIHVHAPHRKEHSWGDRGWDCFIGLTVGGCEHMKQQGITSYD